MYDIAIIGAGVVGSAIARRLSRYALKVCLIEKQDDVSCGASKANSGIVHGGYSDEPGTLKAEMCVKGNRMYAQLDSELHFGYRECGSLVLAFADADKAGLERLYDMGIANGVGGMSIIGREEILALEPHVSPEVKWALLCRNAGVCSPYEFTIALAENAADNGVELKLNSEVTAITRIGGGFRLTCAGGLIDAEIVINAAGAYSDKIAQMAGAGDFRIIPRKGQYVLFNKDQSYLAHMVLFQLPTAEGKGVLVTTTYHGNLMIGPNAQETGSRDDVSTDAEILESIVKTARRSVPGFNMAKAITSFAGVRPTGEKGDFIIEESKVKGFVNVACIDSPGLTSSPAIACRVEEILKGMGVALEPKPDYLPQRRPIIVKKGDDFDGDINASDPRKHMICRCERVTEAEIIDSLHRSVPTHSIDGIKRRTRAGMGMCQGAFCSPRVRALIAHELGISEDEVPKRGPGSSILPDRAARSQVMKIDK
jgi:glycerol-3-phosphate dehydrogenase